MPQSVTEFESTCALMPIRNSAVCQKIVELMGDRVMWYDFIDEHANVQITTDPKSSPHRIGGVYFAPFCYVEAGARIGKHCYIGPYAHVPSNAVVSDFGLVTSSTYC